MISHLGSFILSNSKRMINKFLFAINGFKEKIVSYTDTISLSKKYWSVLGRKKYWEKNGSKKK